MCKAGGPAAPLWGTTCVLENLAVSMSAWGVTMISARVACGRRALVRSLRQRAVWGRRAPGRSLRRCRRALRSGKPWRWYVWRFDVTLVEAITDRITFDLAWTRTSPRVPDGSLTQKQRLTLREGESRPIDLIHGAPGTECVSVALEVSAGIIDEPVPEKTILWDSWFGAGPQLEPTHKALTTAQGEGATFAFEPVATTLTRVNGTTDNSWIQVDGQLRGRVRPDGRVDVSLSAERMVSSGRRPVPRTAAQRRLGPAGGSGQKHFSIQPGEAVKIVLPPISSSPAPSATGGEMSLVIQARVR